MLPGSGAKRCRSAFEIGEAAGLEFGINDGGEFSLAGAFVSERQQLDRGTAGPLLAVGGKQRLEGRR